MGLGWGSLKHMNDVMKHNRALLGKKRSIREIYREEIRKRGTTYEHESLDNVRARVAMALGKRRAMGVIQGILAVLMFCSLTVFIVWALVGVDPVVEGKGKYDDTTNLYTTRVYDLPGGIKSKTDYFVHGPRAAYTHLKDGRKHLYSESYYESGERFRTALYFEDALIADHYFYKTGDTIPDFPVLPGDKVYSVKLLDSTSAIEIEFDFFDGKIVQGTYRETPVVK